MTIHNSTPPPRLVICMKWGTKYGPEYVDRLYGMVRRHVTGPLRFVCLTDNSHGIRTEVECLPLPDLPLPDGIPERGWKKLTIFKDKLHDLTGTALFLDLDIVIVGNIDALFENGRRVPDHPRLETPVADHRQLFRLPL